MGLLYNCIICEQMYINLLLDLSREDLRKLFWKCIKIVTDFYNCLLKDFQIYTLPNFFFIIGRRKFLLQKRKFSGRLVSKFYLLLSHPPPLLKVCAAVTTFGNVIRAFSSGNKIQISTSQFSNEKFNCSKNGRKKFPCPGKCLRKFLNQ